MSIISKKSYRADFEIFVRKHTSKPYSIIKYEIKIKFKAFTIRCQTPKFSVGMLAALGHLSLCRRSRSDSCDKRVVTPVITALITVITGPACSSNDRSEITQTPRM